MPHIALLGRSGAGKTTVARVLEESYGFVRCSIAKPCKAAVGSLIASWQGEWEPHTAEDAARRCEQFRDASRPVLQALATLLHAVDRDAIVRDLTARAAAQDLEIVVDDCRMPYEVECFMRAGWLVVRIDSYVANVANAANNAEPHVEPHVEPPYAQSVAIDHVTESAVDDAPTHLIIENTGTLDDLYRAVHRLASFLLVPTPHESPGLLQKNDSLLTYARR